MLKIGRENNNTRSVFHLFILGKTHQAKAAIRPRTIQNTRAEIRASARKINVATRKSVKIIARIFGIFILSCLTWIFIVHVEEIDLYKSIPLNLKRVLPCFPLGFEIMLKSIKKGFDYVVNKYGRIEYYELDNRGRLVKSRL